MTPEEIAAEVARQRELEKEGSGRGSSVARKGRWEGSGGGSGRRVNGAGPWTRPTLDAGSRGKRNRWVTKRKIKMKAAAPLPGM